jgi:hypothetical protein
MEIWPQLKKVLEFKRHLKIENVNVPTFSTVEEFKVLNRKNLSGWLRDSSLGETMALVHSSFHPPAFVENCVGVNYRVEIIWILIQGKH